MTYLKIIDFHTHVYPEAIAEKATKSIRQFYEIEGGGMLGTTEQLLERGKTAGIEKFVVLPVSVKPDYTRHINEFILSEREKHPEFIGFGTVHAEQNNIIEEGEFILNNGLKGIKMHPDTQLFPIDDERLFPLYDYIGDKLIFMFHCGDKRYDYSSPVRLRRVLDNFPKLRVVAAHFGGYSVWDTAAEHLRDTDCMLDISSSLMFMDEEMKSKYINVYGADRLLYGTDFPLWDPIEEVKRFMQLKLTDTEREKIAFRNAERILG